MSDNEQEQNSDIEVISDSGDEEELISDDEEQPKNNKKEEEHDEDIENWQDYPGNAEVGEGEVPDLLIGDDDDDEDDFIQDSNIITEDDDDDDEDDDDDDDDDNKSSDYIENKIDDEFKLNFIKSVHPEELVDSFYEINALTQIKKKGVNEENIYNLIQDENHKTYPFLSKYEMARILGLRISQLNNGAPPLIKLKNKIIDNHIVAKQELLEKKLPFIIMRPLPNGKKEYWKLEDLAIIER